MKTLKITLIAIFSIGLLTAVLPFQEIKSTVDSSNNETSKMIINLTTMLDKDVKKIPRKG